jgi:hypothetical protein
MSALHLAGIEYFSALECCVRPSRAIRPRAAPLSELYQISIMLSFGNYLSRDIYFFKFPVARALADVPDPLYRLPRQPK